MGVQVQAVTRLHRGQEGRKVALDPSEVHLVEQQEVGAPGVLLRTQDKLQGGLRLERRLGVQGVEVAEETGGIPPVRPYRDQFPVCALPQSHQFARGAGVLEQELGLARPGQAREDGEALGGALGGGVRLAEPPGGVEREHLVAAEDEALLLRQLLEPGPQRAEGGQGRVLTHRGRGLGGLGGRSVGLLQLIGETRSQGAALGGQLTVVGAYPLDDAREVGPPQVPSGQVAGLAARSERRQHGLDVAGAERAGLQSPQHVGEALQVDHQRLGEDGLAALVEQRLAVLRRAVVVSDLLDEAEVAKVAHHRQEVAATRGRLPQLPPHAGSEQLERLRLQALPKDEPDGVEPAGVEVEPAVLPGQGLGLEDAELGGLVVGAGLRGGLGRGVGQAPRCDGLGVVVQPPAEDRAAGVLTEIRFIAEHVAEAGASEHVVLGPPEASLSHEEVAHGEERRLVPGADEVARTKRVEGADEARSRDVPVQHLGQSSEQLVVDLLELLCAAGGRGIEGALAEQHQLIDEGGVDGRGRDVDALRGSGGAEAGALPEGLLRRRRPQGCLVLVGDRAELALVVIDPGAPRGDLDEAVPKLLQPGLVEALALHRVFLRLPPSAAWAASSAARSAFSFRSRVTISTLSSGSTPFQP